MVRTRGPVGMAEEGIASSPELWEADRVITGQEFI